MRTPMQELIEWIDTIISVLPDGSGAKNQMIIAKEKAESMLEKEKEVIIETSKNSYIAGYLDNQAKVDDSMNFSEEYYNETFNTKEK